MTAEIQKGAVDAREYDTGICIPCAGVWRFAGGHGNRKMDGSARGRSQGFGNNVSENHRKSFG